MSFLIDGFVLVQREMVKMALQNKTLFNHKNEEDKLMEKREYYKPEDKVKIIREHLVVVY